MNAELPSLDSFQYFILGYITLVKPALNLEWIVSGSLERG